MDSAEDHLHRSSQGGHAVASHKPASCRCWQPAAFSVSGVWPSQGWRSPLASASLYTADLLLSHAYRASQTLHKLASLASPHRVEYMVQTCTINYKEPKAAKSPSQAQVHVQGTSQSSLLSLQESILLLTASECELAAPGSGAPL